MWRTGRMIGLGLLLAGLSGGAGAVERLGVDGKPLPVRTEEDAKRGRENVKSVAAQLAELFAAAPVPKMVKTPPLPPYFKIISLYSAKGAPKKATLIYKCRFNTAEKLKNAVDGITESGIVETTAERNMLLVTERAENIEAVKEALIALDQPAPQILVEARIVEVLVGDGMRRNLSVQFNHAGTTTDGLGNESAIKSSTGFKTSSESDNGDLGGMANWTFGSGKDNVNVAFQWLLNAKDARIISSPNILLTHNEESEISTGQDEPIQELSNNGSNVTTSTTFKRVGVTLKITPLMLNRDSAVLTVEPEISNIQSYQTIYQAGGSYQVPVISVRSMKTNLKLNNGQMAVFGGLYNNTEAMQQERIPFLSDIPGLGDLFTSKTYSKDVTQLVFFVRLRIIQADEVAAGVIFDPNAVIKESDALSKIIREAPDMPRLPETTLEQIKREFADSPASRPETGAAPLPEAPSK